MSILFFKPIPRPAIWGHTLVKDYFDYCDFPDGIGQSWSFSAQENASTFCITEPFVGKTLHELWNSHQELFGHPNEPFPVIISLVGPEDDLSIQVHPDNIYALKEGFNSGKNEAWYFIEAMPNYNIVYGHNASSPEDLKDYIRNEHWDDLIRYLDVKSDDFVYLPAGLLHALRKGSVVYEIQQATDITYRFYDYHRKDSQGNERELHLDKAIECLNYDQSKMENNVQPIEKKYDNIKETVYISNDSFTVTKLEVSGLSSYIYNNYQLATVVKGCGKTDGVEIKMGDNFIIPINNKVEFDGQMIIMMTTK